MGEYHEACTLDEIDKLKIIQPSTGPRVNMDTILLASWVKKLRGDSKFLEAGCATGAISLLLASKFTKNFHITGLDIQSELIKIAITNAQNNNLAERVNFIAGDLRDKNLFARESFDGLVINPPYSSISAGRESDNIARSTARLEITCTPDNVGELAFRVLKSRGRLFAVFASARLDVFMNSMTKYKITPKRLKPVYPKINCNSGIFLIECVKHGGEGLIVMPPLIIRDKDNNYTHDLLDLYKF